MEFGICRRGQAPSRDFEDPNSPGEPIAGLLPRWVNTAEIKALARIGNIWATSSLPPLVDFSNVYWIRRGLLYTFIHVERTNTSVFTTLALWKFAINRFS